MLFRSEQLEALLPNGGSSPRADAAYRLSANVLCRVALDRNRTEWDTRVVWAEYIHEAKLRQYDINLCREELGLPQLASISLPGNPNVMSIQRAGKTDSIISGQEQLTDSVTRSPMTLGIRVALVIGNSAYEHSPRLDNPGNDAELMATTLAKVGFKIGRAHV